MQYRTIPRSDLEVSVIGFGGSPLGNVFGEIDAAEGERSVHYAMDSGINFFDVSPFYGRTLAEQRLGAALAGRRDKVILSTKCGRYDQNDFDFSAARVMKSAEESLQRLKTDYVDLFHAHDIDFSDREQIVNETIPALLKLKEQGKARLVGVTGFPLKLLADTAVRGGVDIVLSYCRYNLLVRDLSTELVPVLERHNVGLLNASPLHMGILTEQGPPEWHPAPAEVKQAGRKIVELCRTRGAAATDIALQFCVQHPYISSTFVGMTTKAQVDANLRALDTKIDPELMAEIERLVAPVLNKTWQSGPPENQD
jgi:L-galactose dehydrogenase